MEHEKISLPANAQQVNSAQGDLPEDANAGDNGVPSNDDDLDGSGHNGADSERNDEDHDKDHDEDEDKDKDFLLDASNQYWIFVDKQLVRFRMKANKLVMAEQPAEEVLRW